MDVKSLYGALNYINYIRGSKLNWPMLSVGIKQSIKIISKHIHCGIIFPVYTVHRVVCVIANYF